MLVDDVTIKVKGGDGGRGSVAFQSVKMALGPTGGSGGHGGSVYLVGVSDISALKQFRFQKDVIAKDGENGRKQFVDGERGGELRVPVPVGTVVHNVDTNTTREIVKVGEELLVAKGGRGGKGNFHFRSSTNTTPKEFQPGLPGEIFNLRLELRLIADVGLVGLPNAGKSSLLNTLTRASAKVANYPFTTLEPNLGAYFDLLIADIPGIIEGASEGKGLGVKFLRHVARTRVLFHLISLESADVLADYKTIRNELETYDPIFKEKKEFVILTKTDMVTPEVAKAAMTKLKKHKPIAISVIDDASLESVKKILNALAKEKHV
ncbi:MAG TPA: GTPase ObgE [Candidatus Paceibacterota bacterium]